jgi:hypothetical protein
MSTVASSSTPVTTAASAGTGTDTDVAVRSVTAVALASLALIHVEDLPDTYAATRLVGSEYVALIAVSIALAAALLIRRAGVRLWLVAGAVAGAAMIAYILSRTTGIPGDDGDIGNWRCSLGLAALTVEMMILTLSTWSAAALVRQRPGPRRRTGVRPRTISRDDASRRQLNLPTPTSLLECNRLAHQFRIRSGP